MPYFKNQKPDDDFVVDLEQVQDYQYVPDGIHAVLLVGWRKCRSREGKERIRFSCKILDGDGAGAVVPMDFYWHTAAAKRFTRDQCRRLGIDPEKPVDNHKPTYAQVKVTNTDYVDEYGKKRTYPVTSFVSALKGDPSASAADAEKAEGVRRKPRNDDVPGAL